MSRMTSAVLLAAAIGGIGSSQPAATPKAGAKTTRVIAEGVGLTADEALKDAFRGAVGQVVGTLVDAETLVRNDRVVTDRVLTLSNGFVKKYEKLSEKTEGGLVRVRIAAQVEPGRVAARLKEVVATVKDVDGESLRAEKLTREEVRTNATALLRKAFAELPKCLVADVIGEPTVRGGTYAFTVRVGVKSDLYAKAVRPLVAILDKAAERKTTVTVVAEKHPLLKATPWWHVRGGGLFPADPEPRRWEPSVVWVATAMDPPGVRSVWNGYALSADVGAALEPLAADFAVSVELLDKDGAVVAEDRFIPCRRNDHEADRHTYLIHGRDGFWLLAEAYNRTAASPRRDAPVAAVHMWVAPFFAMTSPSTIPLAASVPETRGGSFLYQPVVVRRREVTLTDAALARVRSVRGTVVLQPAR